MAAADATVKRRVRASLQFNASSSIAFRLEGVWSIASTN